MASNGATEVTRAADERAGACDLDHPQISLWHPTSLQFVCYGSVSAAERFLLFQTWQYSLYLLPHPAELTVVPLSGDSVTAESEQPLVSGNLSFTLLFASLVVWLLLALAQDG